MALPLQNTFDGGTQATSISAANSGGASGAAFNTVTGTAPTFDNTHSHEPGGFSALVTAIGTLQWTTSLGTTQDLYGRLYVWILAIPTTSVAIGRVLTPTSTTIGQYLMRVAVTTGKISNAVKGGTAQISTTALPTGQWNRLEFYAHNVVSGTCTFDCKIFTTADAVTPTETMTQATGTGVSTDTSINGFMLGSASVPGTSVWLDGAQVNSVGLPGPLQYRTPSVSVLQAVSQAAVM